MNTLNFQNLIQLVTGRDFIIKTKDIEIEFEKDYIIYRALPLSLREISFKWKTPKADEKMLRSFITAFTTKYKEPNPIHYTTCAPYFSPSWDEMTPQNQEFAYYHHGSRMFNKSALLKQVEENFSNENIAIGMIKYGFYNTEYGIGIFCFFLTNGVSIAIEAMKAHLKKLSIPFTNEYSDAKWVYRFRIGLTKESHLSIIGKLN